MSEEKKAIESILWYKNLFDKGYCEDCNELCSSGASIPNRDLSNSIEIILDLLQSQQKEIEKNKEFIDYLQNRNIERLDTIIYMANFINDNTPYTKDTKVLENEEGIRTATFTVQYFEKKVEGK